MEGRTNVSDNKLVEYNREIQPLIRKLLEKKEALKDWAKEDGEAQSMRDIIKSDQEALKSYIEETESKLVREIKDLENDIKLAVKACAKGTQYKPADIKAYMMARAKDSVEKVVEKAELFQQLESELE